MGFFSRLFGRESADGVVIRDGMYVIRRAEIAAHIVPPTQPNFVAEGPRTCGRCQQPMRELLITTGGPLGDPAVWREHPVAVDGWVCAACGVLDYPRRFSPEEMNALGGEGAAHARAGRFADAEWCFTRITWNWPGWTAGYIDLASAILESVRATPDLEPLQRHRRRERARALLEQAVETFAADREHNRPEVAAHAHLSLAEVAIEDRALDRARRELDACLALPSVKDETAARARELSAYIAERRDLFEAASKTLGPFLDIQGRPTKPVDTPEARASVVRALEQLAEHHALAPHRWQAAWLLAKGRAALGDEAGALAAWKSAWGSHPGSPEIAREYSLALLRADRVADALEVARAITAAVPSDATLWCNRGVTELLSGNLSDAARCLDESQRLDPSDRIAIAVRARLDDVVAGRRPQPRSLRELERGA